MSRKEWRLRGSRGRWVLIHRRDLLAGEEALCFKGNLIPDVFDPVDPVSVQEALELCQTLAPHLQPSPRSAHEQRTYLESRIQRALDRGDLVMTSREPGVYNIQVAGPQKRGTGIAWPVDVSANLWVSRREHILPGDTLVQVGVEKILDGLVQSAASGKQGEIRELLKIAGPSPKNRLNPDIRDLRSRLALAFRSGEIVVVREKVSSGAGGGGGRGTPAPKGPSADSSRITAAAAEGKSSSVLKPPARAKPAHWIEIRLVGDDGKPIPSEHYRIQLPSGEFSSGQLDQNGWARVDAIPAAGACQVTFPNLEGDAWDRA